MIQSHSLFVLQHISVFEKKNSGLSAHVSASVLITPALDTYTHKSKAEWKIKISFAFAQFGRISMFVQLKCRSNSWKFNCVRPHAKSKIANKPDSRVLAQWFALICVKFDKIVLGKCDDDVVQKFAYKWQLANTTAHSFVCDCMDQSKYAV